MRTPLEEKELELADEQVAQKRYSQKLEAKAQQPILVQRPRNNLWTGTGMPAPRVMPTGQLVGRVALAISDPDLDGGSDFYIGEARADIDGVDVFSWAAPVACTFFRGTRHHEWCDEVAVIRAFAHRNGQIVDFADDVLRDDAPAAAVPQAGPVYPDSPEQVAQPASSETRRQARCGARVEGGDTCCGSVGWLHPPCRRGQPASCAGAGEPRRPED